MRNSELEVLRTHLLVCAKIQSDFFRELPFKWVAGVFASQPVLVVAIFNGPAALFHRYTLLSHLTLCCFLPVRVIPKRIIYIVVIVVILITSSKAVLV